MLQSTDSKTATTQKEPQQSCYIQSPGAFRQTASSSGVCGQQLAWCWSHGCSKRSTAVRDGEPVNPSGWQDKSSEFRLLTLRGPHQPPSHWGLRGPWVSLRRGAEMVIKNVIIFSLFFYYNYHLKTSDLFMDFRIFSRKIMSFEDFGRKP